MINPGWLKTFCTLVEVNHFTLTAKKLFMTQSGVSQHIKKLEQQLNVALLIREGKSFHLTDAGTKLYQQGKVLLKELEHLTESVKADEEKTGVIRVSSPGSIGLKLYPLLLSEQENTPNLQFDYSFAPNKTIATQIVERDIDIGLITEAIEHTDIDSEEIAQEQIVLVTPKTVPSITWDTLLSLGFIAHPDAEHHAHLLLKPNFEQFEYIQQFPHKGFSNQISLILEPVSREIGFTILPINTVKAFDKPHLLNIHSLSLTIYEKIYLCTHKYRLLPKRISYINSLIKTHIK